MNKTFVWALIFYCAMTGSCYAQSTAFTEGNSFYKNGQYDVALERYASILDSGMESASLYFNIGNIYFKKKEWGKAILNYERAARLSPRDPDISFNERLALSKIRTQKLSKSGSFFKFLSEFVFSKLTVNEVTVGLVLLYFSGLMLIASAAFYHKKSSLGWRWGGLSIVLLFILGIICLCDRINTLNHEGIITEKAVSAKFEPSSDATTYFELNEGMKVTILEEQNDWLKARRSDGKTGWIPRNTQDFI